MKQKIIYLIAGVVLILSIALIGSLHNFHFRSYKKIAAKGKLRVAVIENSIDFFHTGDTLAGFQYELVNAVCDSLNLSPRWKVKNNLPEAIEALQEGKVDLIAQNIPVTAPLRKEILFLETIDHSPLVLVQRKAKFNNGNEPIHDPILLGGKTICIPKDSPYILRINNLAEEIADSIVIRKMPANTQAEELMQLVAKGEIDYSVCEKLRAQKFATQMPELYIETPVGFAQMQAWAVNLQSEELKQNIDSILSQVLLSRSFRDIYRKYYY